ncbi:MAG: potassium-transporting ATPase subunit KdpA [Gammaproteobacteria bacterium]|nr:potassium-transporting ATPase subunit KdpA [Gammaproteobacteria bacterium]
MTAQGILQIALFLIAVVLVTKPLGQYMTAVFDGRANFLRLLEAPLYRLAGVKSGEEQDWKHYAGAILFFNLLGVAAVYALQRLQAELPLNPQGMGAVTPDSAFNTAISFATNTNWQGYGGETTMSYLSQMLGLSVQNFLSAATGIVVAIALVRGFARKGSDTLGNAWVDLTRCTLYVLLPIGFVYALFLVSQGVIQNLSAYANLDTLEGGRQTLAMGPVASQEAIKMLGTNGGGFFNANSAHPFENPNALTNFVEMLSIFAIPAGLCWVFGEMVGDRRQGWALLSAMAVIFAGFVLLAFASEQAGNPVLSRLGADQAVSAWQSGGNMEGKEVRFGIANSALFATITTAASCGAVNAMHDSFTPLGGLAPLLLIQLGEVVFGGVGSGLYGMLVFAILAVFIAGLMIGRTPEYLGKKIEVYEMKMVSIAILTTPFLVLAGTAIAVVLEPGLAGRANPGAHGYSEILYAFSSAANNNGSAFAGLSANTPYYNSLLGIAMWLGRFLPMLAVLAIAGSLAAKKRVPAGVGTLTTHGPLFVGLLVGTVLLLGALTFIPALALGPVVEQLMLFAQ